jgi:dTDP-4-dehydrorhamnose 3,5-epimerase-like enzyme
LELNELGTNDPLRARMTALEPRLITIPRFNDKRGSLLVIDWPECLSFEPKRFYYLCDSNPEARRAGHAHWLEEEVILAVHGSITVTANNGSSVWEYRLDRPDVALHVPPLVWHELFDFSADAVCIVFASRKYDEEDYCHDYERFLKSAGPGVV